ncbi:hypothetical protein BT67DRAFT_255795 [Trichocladium antarcticum]|uniref:Uncharacterized protein n=1 Tax=Trichocladium antarcticum TaxID=1450529 RepID=A0AAN6ZEP8_9PEZI|nr:hypothetical protein BT67DRAFT_255795 [Trichocladium antarcticum]
MGCVPMAGLAKITAQRAGMQSIKLRDLCSILCCSERSVAGFPLTRHDRSLIRQETPRAPQSQKRALCRGARAGKVRPRWNRGWWGAEIQTNFERRALLRGKQDRIDAGDSEVSEAAATKPHHVLQALRHGANGCASWSWMQLSFPDVGFQLARMPRALFARASSRCASANLPIRVSDPTQKGRQAVSNPKRSNPPRRHHREKCRASKQDGDGSC